MRLFIAINFPAEIKETIAEIRDNIKEAALRGNFTYDENLHLTLAFLGECSPQQMKMIKTVLDHTIFSNFTLELYKVGYFKGDKGNIWWVGLKESKCLSDLQADLCNRLEQMGFLMENRKFTPHITIAREVKMKSGYVQPEAPQTSFYVASIELMKSERINGKLVYTPVFAVRCQMPVNTFKTF